MGGLALIYTSTPLEWKMTTYVWGRLGTTAFLPALLPHVVHAVASLGVDHGAGHVFAFTGGGGGCAPDGEDFRCLERWADLRGS